MICSAAIIKDIKYEHSKTIMPSSLSVHQLPTDKTCKQHHPCIYTFLLFAEGHSHAEEGWVCLGPLCWQLLPVGNRGGRVLLFPVQGWTVLLERQGLPAQPQTLPDPNRRVETLQTQLSSGLTISPLYDTHLP